MTDGGHRQAVAPYAKLRNDQISLGIQRMFNDVHRL